MTVLLLCGLLAAAEADPFGPALAQVHPWQVRQALTHTLLEAPRDGPAGAAWRRLLPVLLLETPDPAPRDSESAAAWAVRLAGPVLSRWEQPSREPAVLALVAVLRAALGEALPVTALRPAAAAAGRAGGAAELAWLEPLAAAEASCREALAACYRNAGRVDQAVALLPQLPAQSPWLQAELTAAGRSRQVGLPLDLRLAVPSTVGLAALTACGPGRPLGEWVTWRWHNGGPQPARLSLRVELPQITEEARRDVTIPAGQTLSVGVSPALRADLSSLPERPVSLRLRADLDTADGPLTLHDTTAPLPTVADEAPLELSFEAVAAVLAAAGRVRRQTPETLPTARPLPGLGLAGYQALAGELRPQTQPVWLLQAGPRWLLGLWPSSRWGLVRLVDHLGAVRRPSAPTVPHEPARRAGFLPTADRGAVQLDPTRDGLHSKPGQALGVGILPVTSDEQPVGSLDLTVATPGGPSVWLEPAQLAQYGLAAALADGREAAQPALVAALAATRPEACRRLAKEHLRAVEGDGQVLETILEGRYHLLLNEQRGWSFFGHDKPDGRGAAQPLTDREQALVQDLLRRLDELWQQRELAARLVWRLELLAAADPADRAMLEPAARLVEVAPSASPAGSEP
ncbi:MAG: hypothetical protein IT204_09305 [Fimbriimonadaceae bacterium]|nr:hypothetical protein [Fimbriimonadaceae bacterium]